MSAGKQISARKVKRFVVGSLVLLAFSCILFAATKKQSEQNIKGVQVILKNQGEEENFLLAKDVEQLFVTNNNMNILNKSIGSLDLDKIERLAETNPWVKSAEVYVDNNSKLNIEVTQRLPVARIFTRDGHSFYIDTAGFEMPLSERYAYPVAVFTNVPLHSNDSVYNSMKLKMVYLSQVLKEDSFWNDQITQIEVQHENSFNAYTTIGKQKILLGDTTHISAKLSNLFSFYREVSNKIGWNKYEVLDIRYKNQVVASPSFGWIPPKDTNITAVQTAPVEHPAEQVQDSKAVAKPKPEPAKVQQAIKAKPQAIAAAPRKVQDNKPKTVVAKKPEPKTTASKPKYEYTNEKNKPNNKK